MFTPFLAAVAAHMIMTIICYQKPSSILCRYQAAAMLPISACVLVFLRHASQQQQLPAIITEALSEYMCGFLLVCNYRLFKAPVAAPSALRTFRARVSYIFRYLFTARTGLRPDQLPPFATDDRSYVPTKTNFLLRRSFSIVWIACVAYAIKKNPLQIYIADLQHPHEHLISCLGDIDAVGLVVRVYYTLLVLFEMYLGLAMPYATLSCLAVAFFDANVADWPPLFGHVSEAYTLRRWYQ